MKTGARFSAVAGFVVLAGALAGAQSGGAAKPAAKPGAAATTQGKHVTVAVDQVKWGQAPPALPPGAQAAILDGDPAKAGLFVVRLKFPDGYHVPPHWHPTDEHLVILSGTLMVGMGAKADDSAAHAISAGGYAKMPRRTNHFVRAKGETTLQLTAMGPFQVTYVDPKDDPRKKAGTSQR